MSQESHLGPPTTSAYDQQLGVAYDQQPERQQPTDNPTYQSPNERLLQGVVATVSAERAREEQQISPETIDVIRQYLSGSTQNGGPKPQMPAGVPTLEEVEQRARQNGQLVSIGGIYQPDGLNSTTRQNGTNETSPKTSRITQTIENMKQHKNKYTRIGAAALVLVGIVYANNHIEGGILQHIPVIGQHFEKKTPPAQQELNFLAEQLSRKTAIEKPLTTKPLAISKVEAPATKPEIFIGINYTTTDEEGKELTLANGVRMGAVNPYLQINYQYDQNVLANSLAYNPESQTVSIDPSAIKLSLLLLAPSQDPTNVNSAGPEFAYGIAGGLNYNEAIYPILRKQNKNFGAKDIKAFMSTLANPTNETAISNEILAQTYSQLLASPLFLQELTSEINRIIADDIAKIDPNIKVAPIQLTEEMLQHTTAQSVDDTGSSNLSNGLSMASSIQGIQIPTEINSQSKGKQ